MKESRQKALLNKSYSYATLVRGKIVQIVNISGKLNPIVKKRQFEACILVDFKMFWWSLQNMVKGVHKGALISHVNSLVLFLF